MRYRMIRMLTAVTISAILLAGCASSAPSAAAGSETGGAEAADASTAGDTPVDEAVTEAQEDSDTAATGNTAAAEEEEEENYETGDAGLDNPAESHYNAPIGFEGESTAEAGAKRAAEGERQPPRTREHGPGALIIR